MMEAEMTDWAAAAGFKDEAAYKPWYDKVEWHNDECAGRHGVIRGLTTSADRNAAYEALVYYFGPKCGWRKGDDIEFVHMTKVFPPPTKPWQWCGTSVLYEEWHQQDAGARAAVRSFKIGDPVWFEAKGRRHEGVVSGGEKRVAIVVPNEGRWYVPVTEVHRL